MSTQARLLLGVVRVRLAVGYEAGELRQRIQARVSSAAAYRLVRSRHMLGWRASMALSHGRWRLEPGPVCE
jgi:hypothetical protein